MDYQKLVAEKTKKDIMQRENLREKCPYFPCHILKKEEFDCRACYCPFYAVCSQEKSSPWGGYALSNGILACDKCTIMHQKEVVEFVIDLREKGISYEEIYLELIKKYKDVK